LFINYPEGDAVGESKIAKSWGAACLQQVLLAFGTFLIFVVAFIGLVILTLSLPITQDQRPFVIFIGMMLVIVLMILGTIAWGAISLRRRASWLDAVFAPLGLSGKAYLWNGRQYHGQVRGRQVDAYLYRGPNLDIYVASSTITRMGIGQKGRITEAASQITSLPELTFYDPGLQHLTITALDEQWGRGLLNNSTARDAILRLTSAQPEFEFRNLLIQPEAIQLQSNHFNWKGITGKNLQAWMDDLISLAGIAETQPAPLLTASATILERKTRLNRGSIIRPVLGITCAVIAVMLIALFIVIIGLFDLVPKV
jgi:hypothetical protein